MTYFTLLLSANHANNRLQKAALDLLTSKSNLLVEDAFDFLDSLQNEIADLNKNYPRCAPLH